MYYAMDTDRLLKAGCRVARNRIHSLCDPTTERQNKSEAKDNWGPHHVPATPPPQPFSGDWQAKLRAAIELMTARVADDRFARLERELLSVKEHCKQLRGAQSIIVPIETMAPEPFVLR